MKENTNCIVSFANQRGRYVDGLARLATSLRDNFDGDFLGFINEESVGAPKHLLSPYSFKVYCWAHAIALGYRKILWLDASVVAIKDVGPVFDEITRDGYVCQEAGHWVGNWCHDEALEYFGITREQANEMLMYGNAGFLGLDLESEIGKQFYQRWALSMDAGMFKGSWENHRHDMTCGSIIANQLGMVYKKGDEWLEYAPIDSPPINDTIIFKAAGL